MYIYKCILIFVFLHSDGKPTDYAGERVADHIVSYMKKQSLPALSIVVKENFEKFTKENDVVVVAFAKKDSDIESFRGLAEEHRNDFVFGYISDEETAKKEGVKIPGIALYKQFDDGKAIYAGEFGKKVAIEKFLRDESVPLFDQIGGHNYQKYMDMKLPLAFTFFSSEEELEKLAKDIKPLAKENKGKVNFVSIDFTKFGGYAKSLNLKGEKAPMFAIHDVAKDVKFPLDGEFKLDAVKKLVKGVVDGSAKPVLKSEPIPEKNDGDVTIVVGDNYKEASKIWI